MSNRQTFLTGTMSDLVVLKESDAPALVDWLNDATVTQYLGPRIAPLTTRAEEEFIENAYQSVDALLLGIWHKKDQKLIGSTGFHKIDQLNQTAVFGIVIGDSDYWSGGIGTEVVETMLRYAFTIRNLRSVSLQVLGNNPRGLRCYEKCGFSIVGTYPKHVFKSGAWHDELHMIAYNQLYV